MKGEKEQKKNEKKERTDDLLAAKNRERRETKRKKSGEEIKNKKERNKEKRRVIWFTHVKRAIKRRAQCDFALIVGPSHVCLFTKMPWKPNFDNLKTPKMCFQFP